MSHKLGKVFAGTGWAPKSFDPKNSDTAAMISFIGIALVSLGAIVSFPAVYALINDATAAARCWLTKLWANSWTHREIKRITP
jgi:hypothetical protein